MTLVSIDVKNAGYETGPDDRVVIYSPANRNEQGMIISTAETIIPLTDGQAERDLAPGPVVVKILAQGVSDTREKSGYVPESVEGADPISLWDVILDWTPALVDQGILAILSAIDEARSQVDGAIGQVNAVAEDWVDRLVQAGGAIGGGLQPLGQVVETVTLDPPVIGGTKVLTLTGPTRIFLKTAVPGDVMTIIVMQGPGAPHTVTWPGSISWQDGPPALSEVEGRADVITLLCVNGMSWLGFVSGQDMTVPTREIRDSFNRPDAPTLGGTDTGQAWVSNGWTISGNQARAVEGGARAVVDAGEADRVEVSVSPPTGGGAGVVHFRMGVRESAEGTSFYRLVWTNLTNSQSYILRNDGSTQAMIGSYFSLGAMVGDRISLRCIVTDGVATLTVLRNDAVIHTVTDTTPIPEGTYAGIVNINSAPTTIGSAVIDDFQVVYP